MVEDTTMRSLTVVQYFSTMDETAAFLQEHGYIGQIVNIYDFTSYLYLTANGKKTLVQHVKQFLQENIRYEL